MGPASPSCLSGIAPASDPATRLPAPEATFTPTAVGFRPEGRQILSLPREIRDLISAAISQGFDSELQRRGQASRSHTSTRALSAPLDPPSPAHSLCSEDSLAGEEDLGDQELSEAYLFGPFPPHLI